VRGKGGPASGGLGLLEWSGTADDYEMKQSAIAAAAAVAAVVTATSSVALSAASDRSVSDKVVSEPKILHSGPIVSPLFIYFWCDLVF